MTTNATDSTEELDVAAVQLEATVGDVEDNLERAESLARTALEDGADLVALPEFFTSRCVLDDRVWDAVVPQDNAAVELLESLAGEYDATVGGSLLMERDGDVFNTYCLATPDGALQTHDKDVPTMWENAFYVGGGDDGVVETPAGTAGLAVCWELIRHRTIDRLAGRIQYAITGNHWWTLPENWPGVDRLFGPIAQYNRYLSENAPVEFARELGVPVVHASHCGAFDGRYLLYPGDDRGLPYRSRFVGETQVVAADGTVLARRPMAEGPGVVSATIDVPAGPPTGRRSSADGEFWLPELTRFHRLYWHHQNACGRSYYDRHRDEHLG